MKSTIKAMEITFSKNERSLYLVNTLSLFDVKLIDKVYSLADDS